MAQFSIPNRDPNKRRFLFSLTQAFVNSIYKIFYGLKIYGLEHIPKQGGFILAGNHTSWFDPPIYGSSVPREIFFAAKKELFDPLILGALVKFYNSIPIRRRGVDKEAMQILQDLLKKGYGVIIFPEGTRFKDDVLHPPKPGVGLLAVQTKVPVVPMFISGSAKLSNQLYMRKLSITFGAPFKIDSLIEENLDIKDNARKVAKHIMEQIAKVGKVPPPISD